ncbi:MAG TPA: hypothetical protein VIJ14_01265 [Rhabdochlamydiaceae bacterium]
MGRISAQLDEQHEQFQARPDYPPPYQAGLSAPLKIFQFRLFSFRQFSVVVWFVVLGDFRHEYKLPYHPLFDDIAATSKQGL